MQRRADLVATATLNRVTLRAARFEEARTFLGVSWTRN